MDKKLLRELPSVDELLRSAELKDLLSDLNPCIVKDSVRAAIEWFRKGITEGRIRGLNRTDLIRKIRDRLTVLTEPGLRRVVNASGTVLHTNLGRAVLCREAVDALNLAATGPVNLEFDLARAGRGERDSVVEGLLRSLTSAEAACVVNNNAAAVLITLNTLADKKEVVISRGELIEIGGSFRLPEIIEKSGCVLREVGTTNRTHPSDYTSAITEDTALLFKAHRSNYEIVGFTSEVGLKDMVKMGRTHGLPVVEDLGSGSLIDLSPFGMEKEPVVGERVQMGADVVTFSADKLLGGPQAGIIVGKRRFVDRIRRNPLKRALRVDKLTLAALEATLRLYLRPECLVARLPALRFLARPVEDIDKVAQEAKRLLVDRLGPGYTVEVEDGESVVGSGSLPGYALPTRLVAITHEHVKAERIYAVFLSSTPPILGRINRERFLLDMRTIERAEDVCPDLSPAG